jgi:predicted transcriptional regulator
MGYGERRTAPLDRIQFCCYSDITMATSKQNIAIRVPSSLVAELDKLAKAVNRSRAWIGEEALRQYVQVQRWHVSEIEAGLDDLEEGRVVPHAEMVEWLNSWGKPDEKKPPRA